jgi:hypothetical protein
MSTGLVVVCLGLAGTLAAAAHGAGLSRATTAPQAVRLDPVIISNRGMRLAFTQLQRGGLVVFKVHNGSARPERFVIIPKSLGTGGAQGGSGGYRTKLLQPGQLQSFEMEFQLRGVFKLAVVDGKGNERHKGKFVVT